MILKVTMKNVYNTHIEILCDINLIMAIPIKGQLFKLILKIILNFEKFKITIFI